VSDFDLQLRTTLRRRAEDVPAHTEVPHGLAPRARRRIAWNAAAVGVAVAAIVVGAFVGLRTVVGSGAVEPATRAPGPSTGAAIPPTGSDSGTPLAAPCNGRELRVSAALQAAAGSRVGSLVFTNRTARTCTLRSTPVIRLFAQGSVPIVAGVTFASSPPQWVVNHLPRPRGWPVVTVPAGGAATDRIGWSNWCANGGEVPVWRMEAGDGETVIVAGLDAVSVPPCNGPGQPTTIEVGPFEPRAGP
jgi:hypothetical protein